VSKKRRQISKAGVKKKDTDEEKGISCSINLGDKKKRVNLRLTAFCKRLMGKHTFLKDTLQ